MREVVFSGFSPRGLLYAAMLVITLLLVVPTTVNAQWCGITDGCLEEANDAYNICGTDPFTGVCSYYRNGYLTWNDYCWANCCEWGVCTWLTYDSGGNCTQVCWTWNYQMCNYGAGC